MFCFYLQKYQIPLNLFHYEKETPYQLHGYSVHKRLSKKNYFERKEHKGTKTLSFIYLRIKTLRLYIFVTLRLDYYILRIGDSLL